MIAERRDEIGKTRYEDVYGSNGIYTSKIWRQPPNNTGKEELLGTGTAALKKDAQENAANEALKTLARRHGILKEAPKRYKDFF